MRRKGKTHPARTISFETARKKKTPPLTRKVNLMGFQWEGRPSQEGRGRRTVFAQVNSPKKDGGDSFDSSTMAKERQSREFLTEIPVTE